MSVKNHIPVSATSPYSPACSTANTAMSSLDVAAAERFDHLRQQFIGCRVLKSDGDTLDCDAVMAAAGSTLFRCINESILALSEAPPWLRKKPERQIGPEPENCWSTYWWYAVLWLRASDPNSGITLTDQRLVLTPETKYWRDLWGEVVPRLARPSASQKDEVRLWRRVALASADAANYLYCLLRRLKADAVAPPADWPDLDKAAKVTGVNRVTVWRVAKADKSVPFRKVGREMRVDPLWLKEQLLNRWVKTGTDAQMDECAQAIVPAQGTKKGRSGRARPQVQWVCRECQYEPKVDRPDRCEKCGKTDSFVPKLQRLI